MAHVRTLVLRGRFSGVSQSFASSRSFSVRDNSQKQKYKSTSDYCRSIIHLFAFSFQRYVLLTRVWDKCMRFSDTAASQVQLCLDGVAMVYGSGAVKNACQVLAYPAACYVKLPRPEEGGGSIWDFAATACIVGEAGGWVSNSYGQALDLNRRDSTFMNHQGVVYASNERIARYLCISRNGGRP